MRINVFVALLACLAAGSAGAQEQAPSAAEATFRGQLGLDGYARIEYREVDGKASTFDAFMQAVSGGKSFSMDKQGDHSLAVVKVDGKVRPSKPASDDKAGVAELLPALGDRMATLDGRPVRDSDLRGRKMMLSLFFAECVPCIAEVPALNAFAKAHPDVAIYAMTFDDAATASDFVRLRGLQIPVIADAQDYLDRLQVKVYPTMLLVDAQGRILATRHGGTVGNNTLTAKDMEDWAKAAR